MHSSSHHSPSPKRSRAITHRETSAPIRYNRRLLVGRLGRYEFVRVQARVESGGGQQMNQCRETKQNGERCKLPAIGQHGYCWGHDPATKKERKKIAAKGGYARGNREIAAIKEE